MSLGTNGPYILFITDSARMDGKANLVDTIGFANSRACTSTSNWCRDALTPPFWGYRPLQWQLPNPETLLALQPHPQCQIPPIRNVDRTNGAASPRLSRPTIEESTPTRRTSLFAGPDAIQLVRTGSRRGPSARREGSVDCRCHRGTAEGALHSRLKWDDFNQVSQLQLAAGVAKSIEEKRAALAKQVKVRPHQPTWSVPPEHTLGLGCITYQVHRRARVHSRVLEWPGRPTWFPRHLRRLFSFREPTLRRRRLEPWRPLQEPDQETQTIQQH